MTTRIAIIVILAVSVIGRASATAENAIKWSRDPKTGVWTAPEVGLTLRKSIAGFQQKSAEPYDKDGSAFGYWGKHGAVSLIIERRGAGGYPGTGDCTPHVRANYLKVMHEKYGKTDSERSFGLIYGSSGKAGRGVGTLCHFASFPTWGGLPVYSEVGAVLIGDILLEYRYTFANPTGSADLSAFLRAIGMKKV
jgi:hypothetical protein